MIQILFLVLIDLLQPEEVKDDDKSEEEKNDLLKKKQKRRLQRDVMKMQGELEDEQALNKALRDMLRGPVMSQPRLSLLLLPPQVTLLILINIKSAI